ncbi:hypothetical protein QYF36_003452 [Acer negundo]|nr:hypothetical protein QYF36_003452 [Acer negundo]
MLELIEEEEEDDYGILLGIVAVEGERLDIESRGPRHGGSVLDHAVIDRNRAKVTRVKIYDHEQLINFKLSQIDPETTAHFNHPSDPWFFNIGRNSKSKSQEEAEKGSNMSGGDQSKTNEKTNTVPFQKLFTFADSTDAALMIIGTIGALGNGLSMPLAALIFGQLTDSFGQNQNKSGIVDVISKYTLKLVYLAIGAGVASFLEVSCWMVTGERQSARIRALYLKTILRQDIAFFDKETNTGEVIGRMSGDTVLLQDAMGEKVGKFLQLVSTFVGGFVIAFAKGWLLTLVMLTSIAALVLSGGTMALMMLKMASRGQNANAKAATVVEQTIGSIRTVFMKALLLD